MEEPIPPRNLLVIKNSALLGIRLEHICHSFTSTDSFLNSLLPEVFAFKSIEQDIYLSGKVRLRT